MSFETIEGVLEEFQKARPDLTCHRVALYEDEETMGFELYAMLGTEPVMVVPCIPKSEVELMAPMWDRILQLTFKEMGK